LSFPKVTRLDLLGVLGVFVFFFFTLSMAAAPHSVDDVEAACSLFIGLQ